MGHFYETQIQWFELQLVGQKQNGRQKVSPKTLEIIGLLMCCVRLKGKGMSDMANLSTVMHI